MASEEIKRMVNRSLERVSEITKNVREARGRILSEVKEMVKEAEFRPINLLRRLRENYGILGRSTLLRRRREE